MEGLGADISRFEGWVQSFERQMVVHPAQFEPVRWQVKWLEVALEVFQRPVSTTQLLAAAVNA